MKDTDFDELKRARQAHFGALLAVLDEPCPVGRYHIRYLRMLTFFTEYASELTPGILSLEIVRPSRLLLVEDEKLGHNASIRYLMVTRTNPVHISLEKLEMANCLLRALFLSKDLSSLRKRRGYLFAANGLSRSASSTSFRYQDFLSGYLGYQPTHGLDSFCYCSNFYLN